MLHPAQESIASAGYGFDIARVLCGVLQSPSQLRHCGIQTAIGIDKSPFTPDMLAQLLPCDNFASMSKQNRQDLHRLSGKPHPHP
jgi:hypothetical protein